MEMQPEREWVHYSERILKAQLYYILKRKKG